MSCIIRAVCLDNLSEGINAQELGITPKIHRLTAKAGGCQKAQPQASDYDKTRLVCYFTQHSSPVVYRVGRRVAHYTARGRKPRRQPEFFCEKRPDEVNQ